MHCLPDSVRACVENFKYRDYQAVGYSRIVKFLTLRQTKAR